MPGEILSTNAGGTSDMKSDSIMKIKIPSLATRRAACTHMTMERLYGNSQCDVCHRPSVYGWVYRCTQDDNRYTFIDPSMENANDVTLALTGKNMALQKRSSFEMEPKYRMPTPELALGVEKAIQGNQYSSDQVEILRAQKKKVVDVANATIKQFQREALSRDTTHRQGLASLKETILGGSEVAKEEGSSSVPELRMFPYCKFQACHSCRPTYRDRAWQQFDEVYALDASKITESEIWKFYNTRPLASRRVLQDIGRRATAWSSQLSYGYNSLDDAFNNLPGLDSFEDMRQLSMSMPVVQLSDAASLEQQDVTETQRQHRSDTRSFPESMRRRLLKGINGREGPQSDKRRKLNCESRTGTDKMLRNALNDTLLQEAATIPLPEQNITGNLISQASGAEKVDMAGASL